jgi:hypothetical protein
MRLNHTFVVIKKFPSSRVVVHEGKITGIARYGIRHGIHPLVSLVDSQVPYNQRLAEGVALYLNRF